MFYKSITASNLHEKHNRCRQLRHLTAKQVYVGLIFLSSYGHIFGMQSQNPVISQLYHNTTARYNALFIAQEQANYVTHVLRKEETPGYEEILPVYPTYDTLKMAPLEEEISEIIKKSSIVLQYHHTSKQADAAYLLLGIGRHYHNEQAEAIKTLQYLSRKGKMSDMRLAAQITLLRVYVQDSLFKEAQQVVNYIARNPPRSGKNRIHYLLGLAYLAQRLARIPDLVRYLSHVLPLVKNDKYLQTRIHFILGQSYEALGNYDQAGIHYGKCAKRLLPYTFYLESLLRMMACTPNDPKQLKTVRKRFTKQLRERKHKDLRYNIHFHWARMEQRMEQFTAAHTHYAASVADNVENDLLLGRAYEQLAIINYAAEKVLPAAAYYDTAARTLPKTARGYAALKSRADIFQRLSKHHNNKQREDSLLHLSTLSADSLAAFLSIKRVEENARIAEEAAISAKKAVAVKTNLAESIRTKELATDLSTGGKWYFYNTQRLQSGRKLFKETWGDRPLSDNWRVGSQQTFLSPQLSPSATADTTSITTAAENVEVATVSVAELMADIPQDEADKQQAYQRLQDAYYGLGSIYYFELEREKPKGRQTLIELIERFPQSTYRAKVLYLLAKDKELPPAQQNTYGTALRSDYPDSVYTKLLDNPNYLVEQAVAVRELQATYTQAYAAYTQAKYRQAQQVIRRTLRKQREVNSFTDNAQLLDIMLDAKLGIDYLYQYRLSRFLHMFPESDVQQKVEELLRGVRTFQKKRRYSSLPRYVSGRAAQHALMWSCTQRSMADSLQQWLSTLPQIASLAVVPSAVIFLNKQVWMVFMPNFMHADAAMRAYFAYAADKTLQAQMKKHFPNTTTQLLAVSTTNLPMLFATKDIDAYTRFFNKHYLP